MDRLLAEAEEEEQEQEEEEEINPTGVFKTEGGVRGRDQLSCGFKTAGRGAGEGNQPHWC